MQGLERKAMVERQLVPRGICNEKVLAAMLQVPRHRFVPEHLQEEAYFDGPLPIGEGQTISQPYIVALMTEAARLKSSDHVLEIGTGSGYQAAILSQIVKEVYTVERMAPLSKQAQKNCKALGYYNIHFKIDDGTLGWPEQAPFDAILVTAAAPELPPALLEQLAPQGSLIIPVGDAASQQLLRITHTTQELIELVRFVPLIGKQGWEG